MEPRSLGVRAPRKCGEIAGGSRMFCKHLLTGSEAP